MGWRRRARASGCWLGPAGGGASVLGLADGSGGGKVTGLASRTLGGRGCWAAIVVHIDGFLTVGGGVG